MTLNNCSCMTQLDHVRKLLDENRVQDALQEIARSNSESPEIENARAVCLLRLGRFREAADVLRTITFQGNICIPEGVPALFQANFGIAMLATNAKEAALTIAERLENNPCSDIEPLTEAVRRWKKSIGHLGRLGCYLGFYPKKPIPLDLPLGRV